MSKRDRADFQKSDNSVREWYISGDAPKIAVRGAIGTLILWIQDEYGNKLELEMDDFYAAHLANDIAEMVRSIDEYDKDGELL